MRRGLDRAPKEVAHPRARVHLERGRLERVVRQLRKLPWGDEPLVEAWVLSALLERGTARLLRIKRSLQRRDIRAAS